MHEKRRDGTRGAYVGEGVTVAYRDRNGHLWESTTMHHQRILVRPGDTVNYGQPLAVGSGYGDQFASPNAGAPHVHWQLRVDGEIVDPSTGMPYDYLFPERRP